MVWANLRLREWCDADPVGLRWQLGSQAAVVAQIVPALAERLGDLEEPPPLEPEQARFRLCGPRHDSGF